MKTLKDFLPESFGNFNTTDSSSPIPGSQFTRRQHPNERPFKKEDKVKIDPNSSNYANKVGTIEKIKERTIFVKFEDGNVHEFTENHVELDNQKETEKQAHDRALHNLRQLAGILNDRK